MNKESYPGFTLPNDVAEKIYAALTDMEEQGAVFKNGKTCVFWGITAMIGEHTGEEL